MTKKSVGIFLLSILLVILAVIFQQKLSQFRSLGLLGIFLINFFGSATLFLPAPALVFVVAGGLLYQPILVALVSAVGSALGDMLGFFLGQSGKQLFGSKSKSTILQKSLTIVFKRHAGILIFLFALIPNPFFDVVGILAGILSYPPMRFFMILVIARFIRDVLLAYFGASLGVPH